MILTNEGLTRAGRKQMIAIWVLILAPLVSYWVKDTDVWWLLIPAGVAQIFAAAVSVKYLVKADSLAYAAATLFAAVRIVLDDPENTAAQANFRHVSHDGRSFLASEIKGVREVDDVV